MELATRAFLSVGNFALTKKYVEEAKPYIHDNIGYSHVEAHVIFVAEAECLNQDHKPKESEQKFIEAMKWCQDREMKGEKVNFHVIISKSNRSGLQITM